MLAQHIQGSEFDPQHQIFQIFGNTCEVNFTEYYDVAETMTSVSDFVLRMRRSDWPLERG